MGAQHEYARIPDVPARHHPKTGHYIPGSLDRALETMRRRGERALDFWRAGGHWIIKRVRAP